ncbi:MAG: SIS domain-containing protein [Geminicoccaceae bacterium]
MSRMLEESLEAPDRIADQLASDAELYRELGRRLRELDPILVATVARGSSDHAAGFATYVLPLVTGRLVASLPPSLVTLSGEVPRLAGQVALGISQSGGSPDIVRTLAAAKSAGALALALVNETVSPLAEVADVVLPQHAGPERSVAATKSMLASLTGVLRLATAWSGAAELEALLASLPGRLTKAAIAGDVVAPGWADPDGSIYVLARGAALPVAGETALKLKETCGLHAEAFSAAEVRHGPKEIVGPDFLVLALNVEGPGRDDLLAAAAELEAQGARVLRIGDGADAWLRLPEGASQLSAPIEALQAIYPVLAREAVALGRDPDRPRTLKKVTRTL